MTKPPAMPELPEPELGYIETDKSKQPAFSARQMRVALQSAQPAEVSDEVIEEIARGKSNHIEFARAILALRPQAVPMTDEQASELAKVGPVYAPEGKVTRTPQQYRNELRDARVEGIRLAENHHGITQRADGGEVA